MFARNHEADADDGASQYIRLHRVAWLFGPETSSTVVLPSFLGRARRRCKIFTEALIETPHGLIVHFKRAENIAFVLDFINAQMVLVHLLCSILFELMRCSFLFVLDFEICYE
jgi:hypothetical protein